MMLAEVYALERERIAALHVSEGPAGDHAHPVFGEGAEDAALMFLGEAPGADEAASGRPFVGKAGKQLDELLALAGIQRSGVFVTNTVKYRPVNIRNGRASNRTPARVEILAGLNVLRAELSMIRPAIVATLGNVPLAAMLELCGMDRRTIGDCHGERIACSVDGHPFELMPLYHPASAIYNRGLLSVMREDIIKLGKLYSTIKEVRP